MGKHFQILLLCAVAALAVSSLPADAVRAAEQKTAKPVCDLVTEKEAAAVLGSIQQKQAITGPDNCVFTTKGLSLMINRMADQEPEQVDMLIQVPKNRAGAGDVVKDEAGIGQRAVSETSKGRTTIIAASGSTVWTFGVEHVYNRDMSDVLPKLRALAARVVGGK